MDLDTIRTKLQNNSYKEARDFEGDARLLFENCYKFSPGGNFVNQSGQIIFTSLSGIRSGI